MIVIDPAKSLSMETIKQMVLVEYLRHHKGSQKATSEALKIDKKTVYNMMKKLKATFCFS